MIGKDAFDGFSLDAHVGIDFAGRNSAEWGRRRATRRHEGCAEEDEQRTRAAGDGLDHPPSLPRPARIPAIFP